MATINDAISAYATAARGARQAAETTASATINPTQNGPQGDTSFAGMVEGALRKAVDTGHHAEDMGMKAITEEADLRDVVMAVNSAELTLNTVVRVRDKVLSAYQEIIKMPI